MRLDYLNLRAFGHFTGYQISFDSTSNFQMIYGSNEAGKSTTLRSIHYLLFGFPQHTFDNFKHQNSNLRIEGHLQDSNGQVLKYIRRKGRSNTVLNLAENPINENVVNEFLHGLSQANFLNMFALDHVRLREGGESLLQSSGSVGESIFSAASGINILRKILDNLDQDSGKLYRKNASIPEMNRLLAQINTLKSQVAENQLAVTA